MASGWGSRPNGRRHPPGPTSQNTGPPPICFKCGCEGHYVVDCPRGDASTPDGSYSSRAHPPNGNRAGDGSAPQEAQWSHSQNGGAPASHYSHLQSAPVVTRYPPAGQSAEYGNPQGSYTLPVSAPPYQQYPGSGPPAQSYPPPQQGPYQPPPNQHYDPSGAYGQNQPPQTYGAPPPNQQYGNPGYQNQPYGQYPQPNGPPQYGNLGYQNPHHQYGPPAAAPPYQQPPNSYPPQGAYGSPQQPPQWNNTPPAPYGAPPFQPPNTANRPQYNSNLRRNPTGPPRQKPQSQQSRYREHGSQGPRPTPRNSSNFNHNGNHPSRVPGGSASDRNSQTRSGSVSSNAHHSQTGDSAASKSNADRPTTEQENGQSKQAEDGEVPEDDPMDEEFKWELEMIFKENPPTENVALAQPLSTTFDMTPVPLLSPGSGSSVSRYARKDNMKEFIQPIRSQPQWSYLQEDPAFSDAALDGELIPLEDVLEWMAERQGVDPQTLCSRKRQRPNEDPHGSPDSAAAIALSEPPDGDIATSQREVEEVDEEMPNASDVKAPVTAPGTPTLPRAGTPSLDTVDDVWAPQPGEGALSAPVPVDPTEALLASLGVTGSPKPVRKRSAPPEEPNVPHGKRPKTNPPQDRTVHSDRQSMPQQQQHGTGVPKSRSIPYGGPVQGNPTYNGGPQINPPYDNHPHDIPRQDLYGNGMAPSSNPSYHNAQYSAPPPPQYPNGPQYNNAPYGMQQHDPYGDPSAMPPQNGGPPRFQDPWATPQQGNQHGPQTHGTPPYGNAPYSAAPPAPYGNVVPPQGDPSHGGPPRNKSAHGKPPYQPYNNSSQGSQPPQRRSSLPNTRSSTRRGSGTKPRPSRGNLDGAVDTPSPPSEQTPVLEECQNRRASDTVEPDESPLTPTSAEILGKLIQPTRKSSNDKKSADEAARKLRRPQPVVAEAYGRRW